MAKHKIDSRNRVSDWLKVHSVAVGVTITFIIVIGGVIGLYMGNGLLAPTSPLLTQNGTSVQLKVSDHDTNLNFLDNNIDDSTQTPKYDDSQVMQIPRQSDGRIPALFRIEGTVIYK